VEPRSGALTGSLHRISNKATFFEKLKDDTRGTTMTNIYLAADVVEVGKGSELIRGERKGILLDDGPNQDKRTIVVDDLDMN
jgi:hypothetical protein